MITQTEDIKDLSTALIKVQSELEGAKKTSINPFHKNKYADLASVWEAVRETLTKNGLGVVQTTSGDGEKVEITTMLVHTSGQWIRDTLTIRSKDATPQGVGSAITYGRRYGLMAMIGVVPEDDDGEAAQGRGTAKVAAFKTPTQTTIVRPPNTTTN